MVAFPLTLLALAAGTFLLLKAKKELMGKVFEWLAWLIIVLSILYIIGLGLMGWRHHHMVRLEMRDRGMMMNRMGGGPMNMGGGGSCYNANCGGGMMMGHDMPACCMADSTHGKDGKPACCMGDKGTGSSGGKMEEKKK